MKVATRIEHGPLSGHWMLRPDAANILSLVNDSDIVKDEKGAVKQEDIAPVKMESVDTDDMDMDMDDAGDNDDEDEDIEYENALDDPTEE